MQRASAGAIRLLTGVAGIFADSFRDAYVATGMNLMQSIVLSTLGVGRRLARRSSEVNPHGKATAESAETAEIS
jgi:hypothetical protein